MDAVCAILLIAIAVGVALYQIIRHGVKNGILDAQAELDRRNKTK